MATASLAGSQKRMEEMESHRMKLLAEEVLRDFEPNNAHHPPHSDIFNLRNLQILKERAALAGGRATLALMQHQQVMKRFWGAIPMPPPGKQEQKKNSRPTTSNN